MTSPIENKTKKKSIFHVEWGPFYVLIKMLLANSLTIDWKGNKKKAIIKLVTSLIGFAATIALSYLFFYLCQLFGIFSLLSSVPMSVPSIIINILVIFSFIGVLGRTTNELYFASDNKVLLTLPMNGNTLFLGRLGVSFINLYLKALKIEIPFLLGYYLVSGYPIYMYFVIFVIWAIIDLVMLLLAAILSIPNYFLKRYLKTHTLANAITLSVLITLILAFCSFLIGIIPNKIDIFSNWGPYFNAIQNGLNFYTSKLSFFYYASMVCLGGFTGYNFSFFYGYGVAGLYTFLILIGSLVILFFLSLLLAGPFYLHLASGNDEIQAKTKTNKKYSLKADSPYRSQFYKEFLLFVKDSSFTPNYVGIFLALPLLLALISKLFGAMDVNIRGEAMAQVVLLLILLLIALTANGLVANLYSKEGGAFKLNHTYPLKDEVIITSKIIYPAILGSLSIICTTFVMASIRMQTFTSTVFMGLGATLIYLGHLLFSAGVDFSNPKETFGEGSFLSRNENRSYILAFATSFLVAILYYFYLQDPIKWLNDVPSTAGFKIFLLGIIFFLINLVLYRKKIKYIYSKGESL